MHEIQLTGSILRINTIGFHGNIEKGIKFVRKFCDVNNVMITNIDRVNSDLHINNTIHTLGPNDTISLARMLTYCGKYNPNLNVFFQSPGNEADKKHTEAHKPY